MSAAPRVCVAQAYADNIPPAPDGSGSTGDQLRALAFDVTMDRSWTPYIQASYTAPLDEALAARLDPTTTGSAARMTIHLYRNYVGDDGAAGATDPQTMELPGMQVRSLTKDYDAGTMTLRLTGHDQIDQTTMTPVPVTFTAGQTVAFVVSQVGAGNGVSPSSPPLSATLAEDVVWEPGTTAAAFLQSVMGPTGRKILADELHQYWLYTDDTPITPTTPAGGRLYDLTDVIEQAIDANLDAGLFADAVIAQYEWTDSAGVTQKRTDVTNPRGGVQYPVWTVERPETRFPGAGAAEAILGRLQSWRHTRTLRMLWDLEVRPGVMLAIDHGDNTITQGRVQSVSWREDGTMTVEAAYDEWDTGWLTTGYAPVAGVTVNSFEIRRVGVQVQLRVVATIASLPNVTTTGDATNTTVCKLPTELWPTHIGSLNSSGVGRAADGIVTTAGDLQVTAVSPDATQTGTVTLTNIQVSLGGTYMVG